MTTQTRISITLIIFSLVMSASFRAYKFFSNWGSDKSAAEETVSGQDTLSVFEHQLIGDPAQIDKMEMQLRDPDIAPAKTTSAGLIKPLMTEQEVSAAEYVPLPPQPATVIAQQPSADPAVQSNVEKYANNPVLTAFTKDLQTALGPQANFSDVLRPDFDKRNANNPKVQQILLEYTKNPAFMQLMQQMMNDKEFMSAFQKQLNTAAAQQK